MIEFYHMLAQKMLMKACLGPELCRGPLTQLGQLISAHRPLSTETSSKVANLKQDWNISVGKTDDEKAFTIKLNDINLKTPLHNLLRIPNETLALAIANEWKGMRGRKKVDLKTMNLTTLAYTAIDNPFNESKDTIISSIIEYLKFDTIRFRDVEQEELLKRQSRHWDPLVGWFEHKFKCHLPIEYGELTNAISLPRATHDTMERHLLSHSDWPLVGVKSMADNMKSLVLTLCLTERFLKTEQAVDSARLETKFQTDKWSKVEWQHDIEEQTTRARVSAAALFYHLTV